MQPFLKVTYCYFMLGIRRMREHCKTTAAEKTQINHKIGGAPKELKIHPKLQTFLHLLVKPCKKPPQQPCGDSSRARTCIKFS
jgi:hypothetical protein